MSSPQKNGPWYANGLAFACQGCGRCCRGPGGYVWVTDEEVASLAKALHMTDEVFAAKMLRKTPAGLALVDAGNGDCPLLDRDGRCRVYACRPIQCRTWPWWSENLVSPERWEQAAQRCPGMNKGPVQSRLFIECEMAKDF